MRTSTKSTLQRIIKEEIARQTGKRLHEVAGAKFKVNQVVMTIGDADESEQTIKAVYDNVGEALLAAIKTKNASALEIVANQIADRPALAALPCYKMKENGYYYLEMDLEAIPEPVAERRNMKRR